MNGSVRGNLTNATSVLVCSSSLSHQKVDVCHDLLSTTGSTAESVLFASFRDSPDEILEQWIDHAEDPPKHLGIISLNDLPGSADVSAGSELKEKDSTYLKAVNPNNLTQLGVTFTDYLDWADQQYAGESPPITICFDSLTLLLQYNDLQDVVRFLHVLNGHLKAANAVAHFHFDPDVYDQQTLSTLQSVVDAVVEFGRESKHNAPP